MRTFCTVLLGLVLLAGCGGGGGDPRVKSSGGLQAQFAPVPDPPRTGHDSGFVVTLTQNGSPVGGAVVNIATFFKGLNQTGPVATCRETMPGRYEATEVSTGMGGKWEAEVSVSRPNQPDAKFTFPFEVAK